MANPLQVGGNTFHLQRDPGTPGAVQRLTAQGSALHSAAHPTGLAFSQRLFFPEESVQLYYPGAGVALAETVTLSEALNVFVPHVAGVSETVALSEALNTLYAALGNLSETVALSEQVAVLYATIAQLAETVALSDSIDIQTPIVVGLSETVALSEQLNTLYATLVGLVETATLAESASVSAAVASAVAETVSLSEALASAAAFKPGVAEVVSLAEALASVFVGIQGLSETVPLSDGVGASAGVTATLTETVALADLLGSNAGYVAALFDSLGLSEQFSTGAFVSLAEVWSTWAEALGVEATSFRTASAVALPFDLSQPLTQQTKTLRLVHGSTVVLLVPITDALGSYVSAGTITLRVRKSVRETSYLFTKTGTVVGGAVLLPLNTQSLDAGFYIYDLLYTDASAVVTELARAAPLYLEQRSLVLPRTYTPASPLAMPGSAVVQEYVLTGILKDASLSLPYTLPSTAKTVRAEKGANAAVRLTTTVQRANGQYLNEGTAVFTLKKSALDTSVVTSQAVAVSGAAIPFVVLPEVLAVLPPGQYVYDVWYIDNYGAQSPVVPLSTMFVVDPTLN